MSRYRLWQTHASHHSRYTVWSRDLLTEWAITNGFAADLTAHFGVIVRTQQEANQRALCVLGQYAFTEFVVNKLRNY